MTRILNSQHFTLHLDKSDFLITLHVTEGVKIERKVKGKFKGGLTLSPDEAIAIRDLLKDCRFIYTRKNRGNTEEEGREKNRKRWDELLKGDSSGF